MAKKVTLVSPDGNHTVTVDSATQENHYRWNGYTLVEGEKSLAPKKGPAPVTPATAVELPSKDEASSTAAAKNRS